MTEGKLPDGLVLSESKEKHIVSGHVFVVKTTSNNSRRSRPNRFYSFLLEGEIHDLGKEYFKEEVSGRTSNQREYIQYKVGQQITVTKNPPEDPEQRELKVRKSILNTYNLGSTGSLA